MLENFAPFIVVMQKICH